MRKMSKRENEQQENWIIRKFGNEKMRKYEN